MVICITVNTIATLRRSRCHRTTMTRRQGHLSQDAMTRLSGQPVRGSLLTFLTAEYLYGRRHRARVALDDFYPLACANDAIADLRTVRRSRRGRAIGAWQLSAGSLLHALRAKRRCCRWRRPLVRLRLAGDRRRRCDLHPESDIERIAPWANAPLCQAGDGDVRRHAVADESLAALQLVGVALVLVGVWAGSAPATAMKADGTPRRPTRRGVAPVDFLACGRC